MLRKPPMWLPGALQSLLRLSSRLHAALYRRLGGGVAGRHTLLLITRGRRSGKTVATPLFYVQDGGRLYVVASFLGSDREPGWFLNLGHDADVEVEIDGARERRHARVLPVAESAPIWPQLLAVWPAYAAYQKRTTRRIPIVELS